MRLCFDCMNIIIDEEKHICPFCGSPFSALPNIKKFPRLTPGELREGKSQTDQPRFRASFTLPMMCWPMSREASTVWAPMWGETTKLSQSNRGE